MNDARNGQGLGRKISLTGAAALMILGATAIWATLPAPAAAYDQYSLTRTAGNCADCHGDFRANGYISRNDNVAWNTSLHNGHRTTMLNSDCNVCHIGSRFPVPLDQSDGGTGFSPIGCNGCHGRAEPGAANAVKGTGLRQHHDRVGVTVCRTCHTDSNPAGFVAAGENVAPPYYFTPDAAHPNKPTQSCNGNNSESLVAPPLGLDNDGNNVYDLADGFCNPGAVKEDSTPPLVLRLAAPEPSVAGLRVAFNLPSADAARLEAFDISGRVVAQREVGSLGPGRHVIDLVLGRLPSGWYVLRLSQSGQSVTTKAIITK